MSDYDFTIDQIRKTRHQISKKFNHDPKKIVEYYIELQKKYGDRLLAKPQEEHAEASFIKKSNPAVKAAAPRR
ncbi:MAG: hypothetical protein GXO75_12405 [Calditrichaeota bacterium]|nr:hypothetical protein [Calditrichota bacterium]